MVTVPYLACMAFVASIYQLPPRVLPSIQQVEGGQPGMLHANTDGSADLGVMQINTRWVHPLAQFIGAGDATVRARLIGEPCFNIAAAGAILRTYLLESRGDLMRAVGFYHSHTPALSGPYLGRVLSAATHLFASPAIRR